MEKTFTFKFPEGSIIQDTMSNYKYKVLYHFVNPYPPFAPTAWYILDRITPSPEPRNGLQQVIEDPGRFIQIQ